MDIIRKRTKRERAAFYGTDHGQRDKRRHYGSTANTCAKAEMSGFRSPYQRTRMTIERKLPKRYGAI